MRIRDGLWLVVVWAAILATAVFLMRAGRYSTWLFVFLPLVMGALAQWTRPSANAWLAQRQGAVTALVGCTFFLLFGLEGIICLVMALPLAIPLGVLGSSLAFKAKSSIRPVALLLLPLGLGSAVYDVTAAPRLYDVTTSVEIAASPSTVWEHVIAYADMPEPREWLFRTGIAYPRRVRLAGTGVGAMRFCDFSTGAFVEPITVWEPGHRLEFDVIVSAAPMQEWSPYGDIQPAHLHGYFNSRKGRFVLTSLANGHTLLEGTSWYEHGMEPGPYWRWWSDAIIHRIHRRVLTHIKNLSEG